MNRYFQLAIVWLTSWPIYYMKDDGPIRDEYFERLGEFYRNICVIYSVPVETYDKYMSGLETIIYDKDERWFYDIVMRCENYGMYILRDIEKKFKES